MITIFNNKLNVTIEFDATDWIQFTPRLYEDPPNVIIEMKNGFNYFHHAHTCEDCKTFIQALGIDSLDWYISYDQVIKRLDMASIGGREYYVNSLVYEVSSYTQGTKLKLIIHPLGTSEKERQEYLQELVDREDYEGACKIRDLKPIEPKN
jgi:hypothetical protein